MSDIPPITGVSEVVLSVADLPAMRDFYVHVLGFQIHSELSMEAAAPDPDGEPTITFLTICETDTPLGRAGHPQLLALIDYRRHIHAKNRLVGHDVARSTLNHLAFEVPPEHFDQHAQHLRGHGIDPSFSVFPAMNGRAMFFNDPEGNRLELICYYAEITMPQSQDDIRRAYDLASEAYARDFVDELEDKPSDVELLRRFSSLVGDDGLVLDLGCGPGHTTAHLDSLGQQPIGVDLSPQMIAKATSLFPNVNFTVGDFFQLADPDGSVSGVLAFYCIVHLRPDQLVSAFNEMFRVLKSGGLLLLSFHVGSETVLVNNFLDTSATLEFSPFPVADVRTALLSAGFTDIEIHERPPYDSEYPTNRCYIFAHKPQSGITEG